MSTMAETGSRRSRRRFTEEFKQQAVRLVLDEGKLVTAVARELDLVPSALGQWVKHAQADRSKGRSGLTTAEREELVRLRKAVMHTKAALSAALGLNPAEPHCGSRRKSGTS